MNNAVGINRISKEYEKLYSSLFSFTKDRLNTVLLLNDLFIVSILCKKNRVLENELDFDLLLEKFNSFLMTPYNIIKKYKNLLGNYLYKVYSLTKQQRNLNTFEKMFGSVLEKHVNRKDTGSYYTPDDTTKFICWNSIFISVLNKLNVTTRDKIAKGINISNNVEFIDKKLSFEEKIRIIKNFIDDNDKVEIAESIKKIKIIDPTCGSGAFVISAYECIKYLNEHLLDGKLEAKYYYINLFGVDILEDAISLSKARLLIKTIIDDNFSEEVFSILQNNFKCGDALRGSDIVISGDINDFDWRNHGTFDCIVGNPPYVEVENKNDYSHFKSVSCGNLYAYSIERACNISHNDSIISFIVPLPFISTPRMTPIKNYLESKSSIVYYCSFADRPGCLFTGVHQRLTIFFAKVGEEQCRRFSSSHKFWYKEEREKLFKSLEFIENCNDTMPKIGSNIENSIFIKNRICKNSIFDLATNSGEYKLYISSRIGFWAKAFLDKPSTNEVMTLKFNSEVERKIAYCFINSSLFYCLWIFMSDCWHITNRDLKNIKFNYSDLTERQVNKLMDLAIELSQDLENHKVRIDTKQTEFEYKHKYSKKIIDKIDDIFGANIGLDLLEIKYVKNFTLKYRLNKIEEGK